jgi:hypothetical protein
MALQDRWPGEIIHDDAEVYALNQAASADPAPQQAAPAAPEADAPADQGGFPGEVVDPAAAQAPPPAGDLPYDPLGQGDIGFASGDSMVRSLPPGNDEYTHEITNGILTGQITSADQLIQIAAKYGVDPKSWEPERIKQVTDAIAAVHSGKSLGSVGGLEYAAPDVEALRKKDVLPEGLDAAARAAVPFGLGDELGAVVDTVRDGGSLSENLHKNRAVRDYDEENHWWERLGGEIVGSLALPTGVQGVARTAAIDTFKAALGEQLGRGVPLLEAKVTAKEAAKVAARRAATVRLAAEGGGYGAGYGAGSSDGNVGDRALAAVGSGATGAVLSGATGALGTKIASILPKPAGNTEARGIAQAAERQGIDLLPADVGGPVTRRMTGIAAQTIGGVQPIKSAANRMVDQAAAARDRIAATFGETLRPEAAGQQGLLGARAAIASTRNEARVFYSSAEKATEGFKANPEKALAELDQNIAELSETPGGAEGLRTLQTIRDDLASGKVSVRGIRQMRTTLRDQFAKDGLRGSDIERRVNGIVDAAAQDVTDSLNTAGKGEAAALFAKGDAAWKSRAQLIDNVFKPIIGNRDNPRSGEQVIKTLTADLQGNNARAVKFLNALPAEQQGNIRASIIGAMGRSSKGQQNAEGDAFSLGKFLTNWNEIGESAKAAYFGPEARAALNDLAKVAQGAKEAQGYANFSNTGSVGAGVATAAMGLAGIPAFVATVGAQYGIGRLLASPRFARWLARAPKSSLSGPAYIDRLSRVARAEPAIANDVLGLQQRLLETFSGSATARLAADESLNPSAGIGEGQQQQEQPYPGEELPQ